MGSCCSCINKSNKTSQSTTNKVILCYFVKKKIIFNLVLEFPYIKTKFEKKLKNENTNCITKYYN